MMSQPFKVIQNFPKEMPCNIEAEQALIGSILVSNQTGNKKGARIEVLLPIYK